MAQKGKGIASKKASSQKKNLGQLEDLPDLRKLHLKHPGFYEPLCVAYADAASVCIARHHAQSPVPFQVVGDNSDCTRQLSWFHPDESAVKSWGNSDDATRDGAYSIALATMEAELGFVAISRTDRRSGADYLIGPPASDEENAFRLEVSGTESEGPEVEYRLAEKIKQVSRKDELAYACAVGFRVGRVLYRSVKES